MDHIRQTPPTADSGWLDGFTTILQRLQILKTANPCDFHGRFANRPYGPRRFGRISDFMGF